MLLSMYSKIKTKRSIHLIISSCEKSYFVTHLYKAFVNSIIEIINSINIDMI